HALVVKQHPDSARYAESAFVRAELAYHREVSAQHGQPLSAEQAAPLVAYYRTYLTTQDAQHQGTAHFRIGTLEQQADRREPAVQAYRDHLASGDTGHVAEVRFRLGTLHMQLDQRPQAIREFQHYLKTKDATHRPQALYLLGTLHEADGQDDPAETTYQHYLKTKDPAHADEVHFRLALLYQKRPDPTAAERHFAALVEQHPQSPHRTNAAFRRAESHYTVLTSRKQAPDKQALQASAQHYQTYLKLGGQEFRGLAHYRRGMLFQQAGERKTAIGELNAYLKTPKPEHAADANYRLGLLYEHSEQPKSAIRAYRDYLKTGAATHVPEVRFRLGMLQVQLGGLQSAIKELNAYLATGDKAYEAESRFRLGTLHMELEQSSEAIREFNAYLKTGNSTYEAESRFWLGTLHMQSAQYPDAIREFNAYLKTGDPAHQGEVFYLLGGAHEASGQMEPMEQAYLAYLKTKDAAHRDEVHFRLAVHDHQAGNHAAAQSHFAAVVEQHPESPHLVEAVWGRAENRYAALTAQAQEPDPVSLRANAELYQDYLATKDQKNAGLAHYRRGVLLQQAQDRKQAIRELEVALKTPNAEYAPDVHYRLGWLHVQQQQPKQAISEFQNYFKTGDANHVSELRFQLGMLHLQTDDLKSAAAELEKYLETDDRTYEAEAHFRLGLLYAQDGQRNFEAISELQKARAVDADYRDHPEVIQALVTLCEQSCNATDRKALLVEVKDNPKLSPELREGYLVRLTQLRTNSGECGDIQKELESLPVEAVPPVRAKLQYAHGVCRHKAREWAAARTALLDVRDLPEYHAGVYSLRRDSHHELQDWKGLAEEVAHAHETHPDILESGDYALWVEARRQVQDGSGADQAYAAWRTRFPEEFQAVDRLLGWVAVREQLPETEPRIALYRELLALDLDAETRTYVHGRWIETAHELPVKERVAHFRELLPLDLNAETRAYVHSRWIETADGLASPEERIGHYRELLALPLDAEERAYVYSRWIATAHELPVKVRVDHFRDLLGLELNSETQGDVYSRWLKTADG
ncbi:MAG: tetratricopeptide repeat protein, partial [SAR324 cluster bacterium]|nr:tetratricopeptide repeat protein [SAR324 cluster bacterium]